MEYYWISFQINPKFQKVKLATMPKSAKKWIQTNDQNYLYLISLAVDGGFCSTKVSQMKPGKLSLARWMNACALILRYYMTLKKPSQNLIYLVNFIQKVYVPIFFRIKNEPYLKDGSRHFHQMIRLIKAVSDEVGYDYLELLTPALQRNSYFAHSENIILAMISDKDRAIRTLGYKKIRSARLFAKNNNRNTNLPRVFRVPDKDLNLNAISYYDMIKWSENSTFEPPLTKHFTKEEIDYYSKSEGIVYIPLFPCHNQTVERHIPVISETCKKKKIGSAAITYAHNIVYGRKLFPTKGQFEDFQFAGSSYFKNSDSE